MRPDSLFTLDAISLTFLHGLALTTSWRLTALLNQLHSYKGKERKKERRKGTKEKDRKWEKSVKERKNWRSWSNWKAIHLNLWPRVVYIHALPPDVNTHWPFTSTWVQHKQLISPSCTLTQTFNTKKKERKGKHMRICIGRKRTNWETSVTATASICYSFSHWLSASPPLQIGPTLVGCLIQTTPGQISHTISEHSDPIPQKRAERGAFT